MAGRMANLRFLAKRVMAPKAVLPVRGEGGGPVKLGRPVDQKMPEGDELLWDDGTAHPEWCLDQFDLVTKNEALGYLLGGFALFGGIGLLAAYNDKASRKPYVDREYPFENLKAELGGSFGPSRFTDSGAGGQKNESQSEDEE